jgi:hypothetical protein
LGKSSSIALQGVSPSAPKPSSSTIPGRADERGHLRLWFFPIFWEARWISYHHERQRPQCEAAGVFETREADPRAEQSLQDLVCRIRAQNASALWIASSVKNEGAIIMHGTSAHPGFPFFRIAALERVIVDRYGEARLPDDDEGRDFLLPIADHLAQIDPLRIRPWTAKWMPGLPAPEVDDMIASRKKLIAEYGVTALYWNADALAHEVELDDAARTRTKGWTIGAVDCDKAAREERRKVKRAAAARAKRAAAGATPRSQSIAATKPWINDGFATRRTWERHGKRPRVAIASPAASSSPSMLVTRLRHDDGAAGAAREMGQAGKATSSTAKPLPSSVAALESERRQLQERALQHLNRVTADMMRSDDPAIWQPLLIAATSEWRGHHLIDDHHDHRRQTA